jgi:hypothetical protein
MGERSVYKAQIKESDQLNSLIDRSFLAGFRLVMLVCALRAWTGALTILLCHSSVFRPIAGSLSEGLPVDHTG